MSKAKFKEIPRLFVDAIDFGAAAAGASVTIEYMPERNMEVSELCFEAWDANYQPFARENRSTGNTPAGNAVPAMAALLIEIKEDNNSVPFQKPFRASLLTSGGGQQRVLPLPVRFYEGSRYKITIANSGNVAMLAAQMALLYARADAT